MLDPLSELIEGAQRVSKLVAPSCLAPAAETYNDYLKSSAAAAATTEQMSTNSECDHAVSDNTCGSATCATDTETKDNPLPANRSQSYTLHSTRGERNMSHISKEDDETTDEFFKLVNDFIDTRAASEIVAKYPELAPVTYGTLLEDKLTSSKNVMDLHDHTFGSYSMRDLGIQLLPRRDLLLKCYRDAVCPDTYNAVCEELNKRCERGESCYYKSTFFPHVGQPGPVALSVELEHVICRTLPCCHEEDQVSCLFRLLFTELTKYRKATATNQKSRRCMVCLLVDMATLQFEEDSIATFQDRPSQSFSLIDVADGEHLGLCTMNQPNYFSDLIPISGAGIVRLKDSLDFSEYSVVFDEDQQTWHVNRNRRKD